MLSLFDSKDESKTEPQPQSQPEQKEPESEQPAPRQRRKLADLDGIFSSIDEAKAETTQSRLDFGKKESASAESRVVQVRARDEQAAPRLSPVLKDFLPPDLWRKLNGETPRSGIYINALERLNSLLYTISTYLPAGLVQEKLSRPVPGLVSSKMLSGCLLFSDVSGFTALSERLAALGPQGAEHLTGFINQYFTTMIDIISWSNGSLLKFAGDATLIFFPEQENGVHAQWAARAGLRMLRAMSAFSNISTPLGPVSLSMKLGLAAGPFLAASVGSARRMEYGLIGSTVSQTLQAEGCASPGQMAANQLAADLLRDTYPMSEVKPGFFLVKPGADVALDEFEIRPEKRRARGSMSWDASIDDLKNEIETVLQKIQSLTPYLASELLDRIITHAYQRQVESEYRPTTVMFCNFTGPENLLNLWGPAGEQRVTGLLSAYFNDMNDVISRFGGIVSRIDPYSQGTKLLALFGAPVAHEDDPQRAVSAALAMNSALQALNRRWAQKMARHMPPGSPENLIEHRIGITLGETFAGQAGSSTRREYTVMGDEVNLAARLMSTAAPGQILISEPVLERVSAYYVTRSLPAVRVKGKKKPIPIWQVDGPRGDTLLNRITSRAPLLGRLREQERAAQLIQDAKSGAGSLLSITGPAGIGKSHLADSMLKHAMEDGWQVQAFQCRSYLMEEPNSCWSGILRSLAGMTPIDHPLIQKEKLERLIAELGLGSIHATALVNLLGLRQASLAPEGEISSEPAPGEDLIDLVKQKRASRRASSLDVLSQLDGMSAPQGINPDGDKDRELERQQNALAAVISTLASRRPLAIFFEDAHWMDATSRATLSKLVVKLASQPVFFLLAGRDEDNFAEKSEKIVLAPFDRNETSAMVASIITAGLSEIIHEQSNGSPLFVEEISRWIKRTHNIDEVGLKSVLQSSDMLQKLVLSSLESLPESQREVARLASVIGLEFRRSEVEALMGDKLDPVTLSSYLLSLTQARLIALSEASVDPRYIFSQSIFRDILYTSLPFERRRELHAQIAEQLKTQPTRRRQIRDKIAAFLDDGALDNPIHDAERLAHHFEMSEQWLPAANQINEIASMTRPSAQTMAGLQASYTRALALLDHIPADAVDDAVGLEKIRAHMGLGDIALRQGELPAAAAAYETAAVQPSGALPANMAAGLAGRRALALPSQGKAAQAQKQLDDFIAKTPGAETWKLYALKAWLAWRSGQDPAEWLASSREALPETGSSQVVRVKALLDDLARDWDPAIQAYQRLGESTSAALALVRRADELLLAGNFSAAAENYAASAIIWKQADAYCGLALVHYRRAELAWREHNSPRQALSALEESLAALAKAPAALQTGPRAIVQKTLVSMKSRPEAAWEPWQWQPFDDLSRIHLLLPTL
jgi:class 3 adenylate cyclase/tetratricopeptide (TPR) repeat protein